MKDFFNPLKMTTKQKMELAYKVKENCYSSDQKIKESIYMNVPDLCDILIFTLRELDQLKNPQHQGLPHGHR